MKFPFSAKADMMSSLMKSKEEQIEDIKNLVYEMLNLAGKCNGGVWGHQLDELDYKLHALAKPIRKKRKLTR